MASEKTAEADEAKEKDDETPAEGEGAPARRRLPGKKLVLFVGAPILLLGLIGGGLFFTGMADPLLAIVGMGGGDAAHVEEEAKPEKTVFLELPEMLVNLQGDGKRSNYLKVKVSLELGTDADIKHVQEVMPRVIDNFQVYLRDLRLEDLQGSAGMYRLREELLLRTAKAIEPAKIHDVLFTEMLAQ